MGLIAKYHDTIIKIVEAFLMWVSEQFADVIRLPYLPLLYAIFGYSESARFGLSRLAT